MGDYPAGSTAKVYYDGDENPRTLYWMIRNEPDWARSRIIEGEKAIAENAKLRKVAEAAALYVSEPDMDTYLYNLEDALLEAGYKI